jgi:hypothetical protein
MHAAAADDDDDVGHVALNNTAIYVYYTLYVCE